MVLPKTGLGSSRLNRSTLNNRFKSGSTTPSIPVPQTTKHVMGSQNRSEEPKRTRFGETKEWDPNKQPLPLQSPPRTYAGQSNLSSLKRTTFDSNKNKDFDVTTLGSVIDRLPTGIYLEEANAEVSTGRPSPSETPDFNAEGVDSSGALDEMVDPTLSSASADGDGERVNLMNTYDHGLGGALTATGDAYKKVAIVGGGALVNFWNQFGQSGQSDKKEEDSKGGPVIDGTWLDTAVSGIGTGIADWWKETTKPTEKVVPYESSITAFGQEDTGQVLNEREYIKETASGTDFNSGLDLEGRMAAYTLYGRGYIPGSNKTDIAKLQPNKPAKDNFNTFTTPTPFYGSTKAEQDAIAKSKTDNPKEWASVGTVGKWSTEQPDNTFKVSGKNPSAETHGKIQTGLNQKYLDNQYNNISNVWQANFTLKFGSDSQPTKAEAREYINSAKNQIANQDNIGGYNMGTGYQDMYINELESKMTNLYGMPGQEINDGRPANVQKTTAEKLLDKQSSGVQLTNKEKKKLDTLTGSNTASLSFSQVAFNTMKSNYLDVNPGAQGLPLGGSKKIEYEKRKALGQTGGGAPPTISWEELASTGYKDVINSDKKSGKPIDYYNYFG